ncbi:MAG: hypothetical protein IJT57_01525, partial [Selenomonadaceae bacterium]|nr:hypothetical protein [Selenomonadaceae bacterium]
IGHSYLRVNRRLGISGLAQRRVATFPYHYPPEFKSLKQIAWGNFFVTNRRGVRIKGRKKFLTIKPPHKANLPKNPLPLKANP